MFFSHNRLITKEKEGSLLQRVFKKNYTKQLYYELKSLVIECKKEEKIPQFLFSFYFSHSQTAAQNESHYLTHLCNKKLSGFWNGHAKCQTRKTDLKYISD